MPNCTKRCKKQIPCDDCPFENALDNLIELSQELNLYEDLTELTLEEAEIVNAMDDFEIEPVNSYTIKAKITKISKGNIGSNFDDFLEEEGILEEVQEVAKIKAKNYKELYSHMSNEAIMSAETKTSTFLEMIRLNEILEECDEVINSPEFKDMFPVSQQFWRQKYIDAHQELELLVQQSIQEGLDDIEAGRYVDGKEAMNNILRRITGDDV